MNFDELYKSIKNKFNEHNEMFLEREKLAIQITDVFDNAFYILWENDKCSLEPFHYNDYNVSINASQYDIEQLFTKRQYLFLARQSMNIKGSFVDVMDFQKLLSYITKDNNYNVQEEVISKMLFKQDSLRDDLGIIMQSLHLLLVNSLINLPEQNIQKLSENKSFEKLSSTFNEKKSEGKKTTAKKNKKFVEKIS